VVFQQNVTSLPAGRPACNAEFIRYWCHAVADGSGLRGNALPLKTNAHKLRLQCILEVPAEVPAGTRGEC
jgi:hypothetical protein